MSNFWWISRLIPCFQSVQFSRSVMSDSENLWTAAHQASQSITNSQSPPRSMSIVFVMPSYHFILCRPLLLLPSIFPSIRISSNESALHIRWPKYWSFSFNISPSNEHSGLISFRMDWLDLLAVQGTLKSLLHYNSKASVLWHSSFFVVQLSHPYITTGRAIALTIRTFVNKVMFLIFNTLSTFVIAFLPKSKCFLISWLQSPSSVFLEPEKIKPLSLSALFPHLFALKYWDRMPWSPFSECWVLRQLSPLSSFTFIKRLFTLLHFLQ